MKWGRRYRQRTGAWVAGSGPGGDGALFGCSSHHHRHAPQVQCRTHQLELAAHLVEAPQAELPEAQDVLEPAVGRLNDDLAAAVLRPALGGLQLGRHRCRVRQPVGIDRPLALAFAPQGLDRIMAGRGGGEILSPDLQPAVLAGLGQFDLVLLVNALHEVFSDALASDRGQIDIPLAKQGVEQALAGAVGCLAAGGWLVLFDGLEPPGDPQAMLRIRFHERQARQDFETFVREYRPWQITYRPLEHPLAVLISRRDFTRYITKSIFLGKALWQTEQLQSYQYFNAEEFRAAISRQNLEICELQTLTMNDEKWRRLVEIETPGVDFPDEHILILARR